MKLIPVSFGLVFLGLCSGLAGAPADPPTTITRELVATHPTVNITPADIQRARENMKRHAWARNHADSIIAEANLWLERSDEWIRAQVPAAGACFAYGFAGCPICGGALGAWDQARASFDDPGHVLCLRGHRLPDEDHPDTGTGYLAPDGRTHYFTGCYNAWVVEALTFKAAKNLALAATLTGDPRYSEKATIILDALAAVYPECSIGSWDYPSRNNSGRFNRPFYQVARTLVHYVDIYDMIYSDSTMTWPSVRSGLVRRENIEQNLLLNGADYCYTKSFRGGLNNGTADYLRGALAVGVCLGVPEYVRWAVDGPYGIRAMLDNNVGRDGSYFETASGYASHARNLYLTFTEPLVNYRGSAYPKGLNLYADARFVRLMQLHNLSTYCNGVLPSYGDSAPLTTCTQIPERPFDPYDTNCLEMLYARTPDRAVWRNTGALLDWLSNGDVDRMRGRSKDKTWLLFHSGDVHGGGTPVAPESLNRMLGCEFLGQKGLAVMRTGSGAASQALLLRCGPTLNHGHRDDLGISYYANGYDLTYDLGYQLGTAHALTGWSVLTTAHNLVLVNEHVQGGKSGNTGGGFHMFESLPGLKVTEASSESSYKDEGVSLYRRTCVLIGGDDGTPAYLVDIFRVAGGTQHDYIFHALGTTTTMAGVQLGPEQRGSMAGPDMDYGDNILVDGDIKGYAGRISWNPPPENGFGFLMRPRTAPAPREAWSADWEISTATRLRLTMPAGIAQEVITADGTGITSLQPRSRYVFARRKGQKLASTYVAAIEAYSTSPLVTKLELLPCADTPSSSSVPAVALRIHRSDGLADVIYSSDDHSPRHVGPYEFAGRLAHVRVRGEEPVAMNLVGAKAISFAGWRVIPQVTDWSGVVGRDTDPEKGTVLTATPLPDGHALEGKTIVFRHDRNSRPVAYRVKSVERAPPEQWKIQLDGPCIIGRGQVEKVLSPTTLTSRIIHEYASPPGRKGETGFLEGKLIRTGNGHAATIQGAACSWQGLELRLNSVQGFSPGDVFYYQDIQPDDRFEILVPARLVKSDDKRYRVFGATEKILTPRGITVSDR